MNCLNQYNSVLYKPTLTVIYLPMPTRANICSWRIILFHTLQRGFLSRLMNSSLAPASHTLKGRVSLSYMFVVSWSLGCTCLPLRKHAKGDLVDRIIFDFFYLKTILSSCIKPKCLFPLLVSSQVISCFYFPFASCWRPAFPKHSSPEHRQRFCEKALNKSIKLFIYC